MTKMMLKNKKALEAEVLIGIIITIAVAAVIFLFMRGWSWKGTIDREACHDSVLMRSMPSVIGEAMKRSIPLKCKTEDILISFEDEELIKQRIATAMHDCWWMLGEGKLNFYTSLTNQYYCVICSTIDFSSKVKSKTISDFQDYLKTEKVPLTNLTYLQYISNNKDKDVNIFGENPQIIDTNKKYAVVFSFIQGGYLAKLLMGGTGAIIGAKAGAVVGSIVGPAGAAIGGGTGFVIGGVIGWITQTKWEGFVSGNEKGYFSSIYLVPYEPEEFKPCTKMDAIP